ncbi:amidohydrolase [Paenibacillus rigui]|uniref:Amidohydrolase n=2 Tax=Paenibacillus rigui TaxID=554312 RepID=A0A229UYN4_9BACL|nr:amidohydrolase [Paenibacillus rigui]
MEPQQGVMNLPGFQTLDSFAKQGRLPGLTSQELRLDLQGKLLLPGLVDAHMHLDKAFSLPQVGNVSGTLLEAIQNYKAMSPKFTQEEIKRRIIKSAMSALSYGTTTIRTHLDFNLKAGKEVAFRTMHAALEAKEMLSGVVDLQLFPMVPFTGITPMELDAVEEAIRLGVDGVGGAPHLSETPFQDIDGIFGLALKYGLPLDLHTDESDDPQVHTVSYIAEQTIRHDYQGRVTVDHLCSLSALSQEKADQAIALMAKADLGAVTLPAVNLYLQGRGDRGLVRRGATRIRELLEAGIRLATASDNIQDPFHPFGRGDLLQIALITAYSAHMGSAADQQTLLRMITEIPASVLGLRNYGVGIGKPIDFVIVDAQSAERMFTEQPVGRWVYKSGKWLHGARQDSSWGSPELTALWDDSVLLLK